MALLFVHSARISFAFLSKRIRARYPLLRQFLTLTASRKAAELPPLEIFSGNMFRPYFVDKYKKRISYLLNKEDFGTSIVIRNYLNPVPINDFKINFKSDSPKRSISRFRNASAMAFNASGSFCATSLPNGCFNSRALIMFSGEEL